ncbi:MAG: hypothetical protein IK099_10255 [Clostridia bacterium]|nr:hypothetical protein [Clostridia bacterium]
MDFFFAVKKDRRGLLQELDAALSRIQDDNRYYSQELSQKYINTYSANVFLNDTELSWLSQHGTVRVGYQDNYLAFCARDPETGELTGMLRDYLDAAANCLGNAHIDFEPIAYPGIDAALPPRRGQRRGGLLSDQQLPIQ